MALHMERIPHLTFNTDGRMSSTENTFVALALVLGAVAVSTSAFHSLHVISKLTGLA